MNNGTKTIARGRDLIVAFLLLTGLLLVASAVPSAFAASPHVKATAVTSTCRSCHTVHSELAASAPSSPNASSAITVSCLGCHDGTEADTSNVATGSTDSFGLPSGHVLGADSPGTADVAGCETCHAVHGASADSRRIPAKRINGVNVASAGNELCLACHSTGAAWFGPGYPEPANPTRDATGYPIAGTWTGPDTYESTSSAHRLIPEATRTVGVSEPVRREQGDCLYCHAAHGGANDYDGLLTTYTVPSTATLAADKADGSYAALCFTCHGGQTPSGFATTPVDIKRFATASGGRGGHAIVTSGGTLPVGSPLPCFECHNPHGSSRDNASMLSDERGANLSTSTDAGVRAFCFTCHTTSDTAHGWDSDAGALAPVALGSEIVGLPRDGALLRLPATSGHAETDTASCYDCHGDSYELDGRNVHNPGSGDPQDLLAVGHMAAEVIVSPALGAYTDPSLEATATSEATRSVEPTTSATEATSSDEPTMPVMPTETTVAVGTAGGWLARRRRRA